MDSNIIYLIYRSRANGLITKYSIVRNIPPNLDEHISDFNKTNEKSTVEKTENKDIVMLIGLAEANTLIKDSDIRSIERSIDSLQDEIYNLKDRLKDQGGK